MKFISWLFTNKRNKQYNTRVKAYFRHYFEGVDWEPGSKKPMYTLNIDSLCITDITTVVSNKRGVNTTITLGKPGLLIGVQGRTLDSLTEYIQRRLEKPFRITIKESTLWQ